MTDETEPVAQNLSLYKENIVIKRAKMTMIWEKWTKTHSCCALTERTEFASFAAAAKHVDTE
jgi:hypothetical protein